MRLIKWQRLEEEWANGKLELEDIITKQFQKLLFKKRNCIPFFKLIFYLLLLFVKRIPLEYLENLEEV